MAISGAVHILVMESMDRENGERTRGFIICLMSWKLTIALVVT